MSRVVKFALLASILAHLILAVVLAAIYLPEQDSAKADAQALKTAGEANEPSSRPVAPEPSRVPEAPNVVDVPPEQIKKSVETQVARSQKLTDEQKLTELEKNLKRLDAIADEASIKQTAETIASSLGIDTDRYAADKPPAEGRFDFDSAQLDDVTRQRTEDGAWRYQSILVDAEGRKMTVTMPEGEGETMYQAFEQMKKYPFAQGIYRGVVMPMLQGMLETERAKTQ